MKLRRLELLRYGHLTDMALEFPEPARLHVVHGANEAGKSTTLAAIADALFGFGHRSDFDFLHGGPQLRIGFTLATGDGTQASFIRRKGRRDTLRDADDQPVPDDALRRFLGGAGRELFERGFGLDGGRLRQGGQELLRVGGEAGESLLAGTGLLNLRAALGRLDEEAKTLVGDGRGTRRLSEAVEAWRKADRESTERAVAPRAWLEADAEHAAAVVALAALQERIRGLSEESSRLQRVRRVAPLLAQLAEARAALVPLADAPQLPADAQTRLGAGADARREALRDGQREAAEAARLGIERAGLGQDPVALAAQDAIDALAARRPVSVQAAGDLPGVQAEVDTLRGRVADALGELGLSVPPEAARDALPTPAARRAVRNLIIQLAGLASEARAAARDLAAGLRRHEQAVELLAAMPEPASPALLRRTIEAVRAEGKLDAELDRARHGLEAAEASAAAALAALPLWAGDLAGLAGCKLPMPAEAEEAASRLAAAGKARDQARSGLAGIAEGIAQAEAERVRLARGGTVPTPEAVAAARALRDQAWRVLRRLHDGGPSPSAVERAEGAEPDRFEALRDAADQLADRRADEAQRVADFLGATSRRDDLGGRLTDATAAVAQAEADADAAEAAWRALWSPTGLIPRAAAAMLEWRRDRAEVLRLAEAAAQMRREADALAVRRDRALAELTALLPDGLASDSLASLLLRAETACAAAEARATEHRDLARALADAQVRLPDLRHGVAATTEALAAWRRDWLPAVAALGLPEDAGVDAAEAAMAAWARIAEAAPEWRTAERRIADMRATIDGFAETLGSVQARLDEQPTGEPAPLVAARLARRLADARQAAAQAADLAGRIAVHEQQAADAARRLAAAEADLAALRVQAGAPDDDALLQAIERARRRDALVETIAMSEQALLRLGDGRAEEALRTEAAEIDADAVVGRLAEIEAELAMLGARREDLSAERTRAEAMLAGMRAGHDAAVAAQQAEDAIAEALAAAERYARLHVARVLLRAGIDRFRREQQDPLLRAAGGHFALLTGGRYQRLIADVDGAGRTVLLAVPAQGAECPVEALSEGARDQLYFALRVAAIEAQTARAEPLPFIADDLLVHFDDVRAAAAIALLAELGQSTQVILFTHHDHIAGLAARQPGVAVQSMRAA